MTNPDLGAIAFIFFILAQLAAVIALRRFQIGEHNTSPWLPKSAETDIHPTSSSQVGDWTQQVH